MTPTLYGIPNCDTVKKARTWLEGRGRGLRLPRLQEGRDRPRVAGTVVRRAWVGDGAEPAGTTFRKLPEADRADLDQDRAIALMLAQPSMIKRPVLDLGDRRIVGFKPEIYEAAFATA
ncbi:ArsC/Spx/MgsR family protein [Brevundimonas denitrificans]|uniref:ArsC/Spx/MgsR family protein n=1 Tax=Brevundimonas denitrificans TaxID=1443434 RepID=UPI00223BE646|nr:ArsC/Spx/MgsR family protein [Brevundimonas denitrificans]